MPDRDMLETFPNPCAVRDYLIEHDATEFTSICPKTGQPDFATIKIRYVADQACLELKQLKLYLQTFRSEGIFYESVTNVILDDLISACRPRKMIIVGEFNVRGGIHTTVTVEHVAKKSAKKKSK